MNLIIQHEYYKEVLTDTGVTRDVEEDAPESTAQDEKFYE